MVTETAASFAGSIFKVTLQNTHVHIFFGGGERFSAKKVCTVCSRTNNKIVPLTNLNKYLYNDKSEIKVNINNSSEKVLKKPYGVKKLNERKGTALL